MPAPEQSIGGKSRPGSIFLCDSSDFRFIAAPAMQRGATLPVDHEDWQSVTFQYIEPSHKLKVAQMSPPHDCRSALRLLCA